MENWMFWLVGVIAVAQIIFLIVDERIAIAHMLILGIGFFMLWSDSIAVYSIGLIFVVHFVSAIIGIWPSSHLAGERLLARVLFVISFSIIYLMTFVFGNMIIVPMLVENAKYNQNVVAIETPEVESTRYEIVSDEDFAGMENVHFTNIIYVVDNDMDRKNLGESYYLIYCNDPVSGEINGAPFCIVESKLDIKLQSNEMEAVESEYLLVVTEKYYKEDRNKVPYERRYTSENIRYELYVTEETFNRKMIISNRQ